MNKKPLLSIWNEKKKITGGDSNAELITLNLSTGPVFYHADNKYESIKIFSRQSQQRNLFVLNGGD